MSVKLIMKGIVEIKCDRCGGIFEYNLQDHMGRRIDKNGNTIYKLIFECPQCTKQASEVVSFKEWFHAKLLNDFIGAL
jgi:Zn finger protein HypA/HybF involved in hydrogenase expression